LCRFCCKSLFWLTNEIFQDRWCVSYAGTSGTTSFHTKTTTDLRIGLQSLAAVEASKNRLSRDFRSRSIFDFCNKICHEQSSGPELRKDWILAECGTSALRSGAEADLASTVMSASSKRATRTPDNGVSKTGAKYRLNRNLRPLLLDIRVRSTGLSNRGHPIQWENCGPRLLKAVDHRSLGHH
jgi:hypothetical protein